MIARTVHLRPHPTGGLTHKGFQEDSGRDAQPSSWTVVLEQIQRSLCVFCRADQLKAEGPDDTPPARAVMMATKPPLQKSAKQRSRGKHAHSKALEKK